jgi:hypothetical protein
MQHFVDMFLSLCDYTHYMLRHSTLVMILHENMDEVDNMDDTEHMTKIDKHYICMMCTWFKLTTKIK